jgi:hypothetical protein
MVAQRHQEKHGLAAGADLVAGNAAHLAGKEVPGRPIEAVNDASRGGADLPAEGKQDSSRDQSASDHDGSGGAHR